MNRFNLLLIITSISFFSCEVKNETKSDTATSTKSSTKAEAEAAPAIQQLITRYYSVKVVNGNPVKDTLMECFHCNQSRIYNKEGKELELRYYKSNMKDTYGNDVYTYNEDGHKTGSSFYEKDSLTTIYKYELDDEHRIKIGKAFDPKSDTLLYGYNNIYSDKGFHVETANINAKDEVYEYYRRVFNKKGVPLFENIEDLDDKPTFKVRYEYRPEADSSWVEQLTYYNDVLKEIRVRERVPFSKK